MCLCVNRTRIQVCLALGPMFFWWSGSCYFSCWKGLFKGLMVDRYVSRWKTWGRWDILRSHCAENLQKTCTQWLLQCIYRVQADIGLQLFLPSLVRQICWPLESILWNFYQAVNEKDWNKVGCCLPLLDITGHFQDFVPSERRQMAMQRSACALISCFRCLHKCTTHTRCMLSPWHNELRISSMLHPLRTIFSRAGNWPCKVSSKIILLLSGPFLLWTWRKLGCNL